MPSRRRRPGPRRAAVLHPTRPRPARLAARPQRSKRPTASRTSGIPHEFRDSGAHGHVLEHCALPGCTAPPRFAASSTPAIAPMPTGSRIGGGRNAQPAPRPHRCPSSSLTTPCRSRRSRRAMSLSISRCWHWCGRITHLKERLIIDPRDDEARARLRELRSRLEGP